MSYAMRRRSGFTLTLKSSGWEVDMESELEKRATLILLINQINWACEEEASESHIHELAWQLVNATRPKDGD